MFKNTPHVLAAVLAFWATGLSAQILSTTTLSRGAVTELQRDSSVVWVYNPTTRPLTIEAVRTAGFYGDTLLDLFLPQNTVAAGDSMAVSVRFTPVHNVEHLLPLVFQTDHELGAFGVKFEADGVYSQAYYATTQNLTEGPLRATLTSLLGSNTSSLSYNVARDNMYGTLDNHGGIVECVYTGRTATFNTRAGATANNFNCEHTFPQSFFSSAAPMVSDIHHLFPSDEIANTQRSNNPFGIITGTPAWTQGGSKRLNGVFEPRDAHKGDCARAMLYFVTRYGDYSNFYLPQEPTLYTWHKTFQPDSLDRYRNDGIYALQNNRNPYVDYPQFLDRISTLVGPTAATAAPSFYLTEDTLHLRHYTNLSNPGTRTRRLIVVNNGNIPLVFSNVQISTSSITDESNWSGATTCPVGGFIEIEVDYNSGQAYVGESLTFQTSHPSFPSVTVPIASVATIGEEELAGPVSFHAWSTQSGLHCEGIQAGDEVRLVGLDGRVWASEHVSVSGAWDFHGELPAVGFVQCLHGADVQIRKFVQTNF
jgi:deoxyribonuclease-1